MGAPAIISVRPSVSVPVRIISSNANTAAIAASKSSNVKTTPITSNKTAEVSHQETTLWMWLAIFLGLQAANSEVNDITQDIHVDP